MVRPEWTADAGFANDATGGAVNSLAPSTALINRPPAVADEGKP